MIIAVLYIILSYPAMLLVRMIVKEPLPIVMYVFAPVACIMGIIVGIDWILKKEV